MGDLSANIARRCRTARENAGLSQGQAAKKLSISRTALSEAESGNRRILATELREMSRIYGVGVSWLACEDGESSDPERDRIELAARELAHLRPEDLDNVLLLVKSIRARDER